LALAAGKTVGRQTELDQLEGALDKLAEGSPAFISAEGEPGIGKTRLLAELRERADARGHVVLAGSAAEFERDVPFGVWVLRAAEAELSECGALHPRNEARRELRKLGARAEPRGPSPAEETGLGALSGREREVAELVSRHKTNPEIAKELYLSVKTIESHLRNVFFKLGVSSRRDVAQVIERARDERVRAG
jgi:DNA-binding CsgD family transcriptional regulator